MAPVLTPRRVLAARVLAILVDLVQFALLPAELTPLNNFIDFATAAAMVALVGWNWAFLPTLVVELVPFVDLVPSWTLAVFFATRGRVAANAPTVSVTRPAPAAEPQPKALPPVTQDPRGPSGS